MATRQQRFSVYFDMQDFDNAVYVIRENDISELSPDELRYDKVVPVEVYEKALHSYLTLAVMEILDEPLEILGNHRDARRFRRLVRQEEFERKQREAAERGSDIEQ